MKKFLKILLAIILLPLGLIALLCYSIYSLIEKLIVKHTTYFKKNKLTIKEAYYFGILNDIAFCISF